MSHDDCQMCRITGHDTHDHGQTAMWWTCGDPGCDHCYEPQPGMFRTWMDVASLVGFLIVSWSIVIGIGALAVYAIGAIL